MRLSCWSIRQVLPMCPERDLWKAIEYINCERADIMNPDIVMVSPLSTV